MKQCYRLISALAIYCLVFSISVTNVVGQVQSPRFVTINGNCNGFYEYLPQGYETGNETYPLMVFIHGIGELGNGTTDLPKVLQNGPPRLINFGLFPTSFTINNTTHKFIVISPQYVTPPTENDVAAVVNYAAQTYRVNQNRIYLTGLSMGGGAAAYYAGINAANANKLAAIVTVCGSVRLPGSLPATIANANLPFWGTHNQVDPTVPTSNTIDNVANINNTIPVPVPLAKITIFPVINDHDAWTQTYDPNFRENGLNVYEWMLTYQRNATVLPIVLQDFKAYKTGEKTVALSWKTTSEENADYFTLERSDDGINFSTLGNVTASNAATGNTYTYTDNNPATGNNFYRLSEVDKSGKTTIYKTIQLAVSGIKKTGIHIYPNPVVNNMILESTETENGVIQLLVADIRGSILKTWSFNNQNPYWKQSIDISFLPAGAYTVRIKGMKTDETIKLIKK
jgi:predicted esterase